MRYITLSVQTSVLAACVSSLFVTVPHELPVAFFLALMPLIFCQLLFNLSSSWRNGTVRPIPKMLMSTLILAAVSVFFHDFINRMGWERYWIATCAGVALLNYSMTWWTTFQPRRSSSKFFTTPKLLMYEDT